MLLFDRAIQRVEVRRLRPCCLLPLSFCSSCGRSHLDSGGDRSLGVMGLSLARLRQIGSFREPEEGSWRAGNVSDYYGVGTSCCCLAVKGL